MEEQRQRQEEEARRAAAASAAEAGMPTPTVDGKKGIWKLWLSLTRKQLTLSSLNEIITWNVLLILLLTVVTESEEALLKMSVSQPESGAAVLPDFSSMTEEEQIAYAMQMSLAGGGQFHLVIAAVCVFALPSIL